MFDPHDEETIPHTTVLIGDVGGHLPFFEDALTAAGVSAGGVVSEGVVVVQVGDLVHKGPDSDACVSLAGKLLDRNPGRYVQLLGNHEAHYLGGPSVAGRSGVTPIIDDPPPAEAGGFRPSATR